MPLSVNSLKEIIAVLILLLPIVCYSQEQEIEHHHHNNEISIATGPVYIPDEDETTVKFHMHYIRGLGEHKRFGIGFALETILDDHNHNTISLATHYRIINGLIVGYSPGILFVKIDDTIETDFAQHLEFAYEFEVGELHLGPVIEMGVDSEEIHYFAGIHVGINF